MSNHLYMVELDAARGREGSFAEWHQRQLPTVLALRGFTSARAFRSTALVRPPSGPPAVFPYLALYEIAGSPTDALSALKSACRQGVFQRSETVAETQRAQLFEPIGTKVESEFSPAGAIHPEHVFVVHTNSVDGAEAEFNDWYSNRHLNDVVAVPGFVAAQRYRLQSNHEAPSSDRFNYLAIYWMTGDPQTALDALALVRRSGSMYISPTLAQPALAHVFTAI